MIAIKTTKLKLSFPDGKHLDFPDWQIRKEHDAVILGRSGSGKTTLLHLLSGLVMPTSGEIEVNGSSINKMSGPQLDAFRRKQVGIVFQQPHLIKSLSVADNLRLAMYLAQTRPDDDWIDQILEQLDLQEIKERNVKRISQGQAQRVAIARATINKPSVLFGDEPTASLDDENCDRVIKLLKQEARFCNATLIVATHDQRVKNQFEQHLQLDK